MLRSVYWYQYNDTNVIHFSVLLRINGIYMFRVLRANPQEALHNGTWYIACVSVIRTQYTKCRLCSES
jgi:hypothetical protein